MKVSYKCSCGQTIRVDYLPGEKISMSYLCPMCKNNAPRVFSTNTAKEDETVSAAIQTMLWSTMPSGKTKAVV